MPAGHDPDRIAGALEIRVELLPQARAADLDRIVNARHAALAEASFAGFGRSAVGSCRPEVSFSEFGERGVVDVLGLACGDARRSS